MLDFNGFDVGRVGRRSVFVSDSGFSVAVDPFDISDRDLSCDIILITGFDQESFELSGLRGLCGSRTVFVVPEGFESVFSGFRDVEVLGEGDAIDVYGVEIEAVPLVNSGFDGLGFRFVLDGTSFYVAGDTSLSENMKNLEKKVDLAFLPLKSEMSVDNAVQSAVKVKPGLAVPYMYDKSDLDGREVEKFKTELLDRSIDCQVLEK